MVASFVEPCECLVDVGTDHAYLPICLVREERVKKAIALDVNPEPLERAKTHIRAAALENVIETRLSDGLAAVEPGEADTVVMAGMGGLLISELLKKAVLRGLRIPRLIVQPQSELDLVRRTLHEVGRRICAEKMCEDAGKRYTVIVSVCGEEQYAPDEYLFGRCLFEARDPVFREALNKEKEEAERILGRLIGPDPSPAVEKRIGKLKSCLETAERMLGEWQSPSES